MAPFSGRGTEKTATERVRQRGECTYCTWGAFPPGTRESLRECTDFLDIIERIEKVREQNYGN